MKKHTSNDSLMSRSTVFAECLVTSGKQPPPRLR